MKDTFHARSASSGDPDEALLVRALQAPEGKVILLADTPQRYADHIIYLLQNNDTRLQMGGNGRSFVIRHFDWENTVAQLAQLLEEAALQDHKL